MTGWIKMGTGLRSHPKVVRMASALKADRLRVVGGLWAVWCVFDEHSVNGCLEGYTLASMDEEIGWRGFSAAMQAVGWLYESESGLQAPDYEEHNGPVAKRRAMETSRKGKARKASAPDAPKKPHNERTEVRNEGGQMSASDADKVRNRIEKRREEEIHPPTPRKRGTVHGFPPGFEAFWSEYPRKQGKEAASKAFARIAPDDALQSRLIAAVRVQRASEDWRKDGGRFVPHASTWLNGKRWLDEVTSDADDVFAGAV